jgi:sorbitol-specific phosphotransferase system component IIC
MLLPIHIAAGGLAIILGAIALSVKKGGTIHRRSGMLFVYAMLVMGTTASILEFLKSAAVTNIVAALMAVYFAGTALTTVRRPSRWTRIINIAALAIASGLALLLIAGGLKAVRAPGLSSGGVPFGTIGVMSFILATVLLLSAIGDVRVMRFGSPTGGKRLARHLWRMCFALFIATGSFFSIRHRVAKILPEPFTTGPMRALPIVLLFGAMFYWLWRVRRPLPDSRCGGGPLPEKDSRAVAVEIGIGE